MKTETLKMKSINAILLWLNPSDNQGVRFLIDDVRVRTPWEDRKAE